MLFQHIKDWEQTLPVPFVLSSSIQKMSVHRGECPRVAEGDGRAEFSPKSWQGHGHDLCRALSSRNRDNYAH